MTALRRGWIHLASGAGLGRVFGFLSNLLLSRWLGPAELGLFNLVTNTVQTSDTLVRFGGDYALNYELGGQSDSVQTHRGLYLSRAFVQICTLTTTLICIVVAVWLWAGNGLFPHSLVPRERFLLGTLLLLMIAFEGISVAAWEILLVSHRTHLLALRQGFFVPLRLLFAAVGALYEGVASAMVGWCIIALFQSIWLRLSLGELWHPLKLYPFLRIHIQHLLKSGIPFYGANLLASMIFYPLLVKVADNSGMAEIGYLKIGQILSQLFAFLPATLSPVLFLRLRAETTFADQVVLIEKPFRFLWFILLEVLLLYCSFDRSLISLLFGNGYIAALQPTRLLLLTTLFECLAQLLVQPLLAAGRIGMYGYWQNGAAVFAAALGWILVPASGLEAYLIVRFIYVIVPFLAFSTPIIRQFREPQKMIVPALLSICFLVLTLFSSLLVGSRLAEPLFVSGAIFLFASQWSDISHFRKLLIRKS